MAQLDIDNHEGRTTSIIIASLLGLLGGWIQLFTPTITNQMIDFLIHIFQSIVFGAAGYAGKIMIDRIFKKSSSKEEKETEL